MPEAEGSAPIPVLRGERLELRPARGEDAEAVAAILSEPEVACWWGAYDVERVREELDEALVILIDGAIAGWLLHYEEDDPQYRHAGFDIGITSAQHGRGYGREALRLVIRHFIEARGHRRFIIDPAAANARAIRTYEAVGFRPVGVMREYELGPDGTWHDGLLMDLLASEFEG